MYFDDDFDFLKAASKSDSSDKEINLKDTYEDDEEEENSSKTETIDGIVVEESLNPEYEQASQNNNNLIGSQIDDGITKEDFDASPLNHVDSITDNSQEKKKNINKSSIKIKEILSGNFVNFISWKDNKKFIIALVISLVLLMVSRSMGENLLIKRTALQKEVDQLRAESIFLAANLINISKESQISQRIKERGIKIKLPQEPPKIFTVDKYIIKDSLKVEGYTKDKKFTYDLD